MLISAGPYIVELSIKQGGKIEAYVTDRSHRAVPYGNSQLTLNAHDEQDGIFPVPLNWSGQRLMYAGRLTVPLATVTWLDLKVRSTDIQRDSGADPGVYWVGSIRTKR